MCNLNALLFASRGERVRCTQVKERKVERWQRKREREGEDSSRAAARSLREAEKQPEPARTTKKKSYPQWQEDGYSARTGNRGESNRQEREREREPCAGQRNKADLSRSNVQDSIGSCTNLERSETVSFRDPFVSGDQQR